MSGQSSHLQVLPHKPRKHRMKSSSSDDAVSKSDYLNDNSMTATASNAEVEKLRRRLLDRELTIAQLQSRMTELSNTSVAPGHMMAAMRANTDHWQDSYHRLSEAHRRLQRVNQGLEDKLLKLADRSQSEKEALTEHTTALTTALTTAAAAMHRLKGEKERLQQDLNIAIQLLQCNSSNYNSHRIDSLPADLQQRVRSRLDAESHQRISSVTAVPKTTEMKIIRVPIPTFPPTAMVYSLNKCSEDGPDEEEVQEAEDRVSAAIMAAVLEERQKEQRHCPTCSCVSGTNNPAASGGNRPGSGGREGTGGSGEGGGRGNSFRGGVNNHSSTIGTNANHMSYFASSVGNVKLVKDLEKDTATAAIFHRSTVTEGSSGRKIKVVESVRAIGNDIGNNRTNSNNMNASQHSIQERCVHNGSSSGNHCNNAHQLFRETSSAHNNTSSYAMAQPTDTSPLIDLHSDNDVISITEQNQGEKTRKRVEINALNITEHFNSDKLGELTVNNCICGRPYSLGTNVIDVGTQTVPSYIGESGKVHSTCIYCKGQKIREKHKNKENKGLQANDVCLNNVSSCRTACNDNCSRSNSYNISHISHMSSSNTIDSECQSLMSSSDVSYCSGSESNTATSSSNSKRVSPPQHNRHKDDSTTPQGSPISMDLSEQAGIVSELSASPTRAGGSSSCSWDWPLHSSALGGSDGGGRDSGSPSTPSSFTSSLSGAVSAATSYNEGDMSCEPSPHLSPRQAGSQQRVQHRRSADLIQVMHTSSPLQQCEAEATSTTKAREAHTREDADLVQAAVAVGTEVFSTSDASTQCIAVPLVSTTVQTSINTDSNEFTSSLTNGRCHRGNSAATSPNTSSSRDLIQLNCSSPLKCTDQTIERSIVSSTADAFIHLPLDAARKTRQLSDSDDSLGDFRVSSHKSSPSASVSRRASTNNIPNAFNWPGRCTGNLPQRSVRTNYPYDMDKSLSLEVSADLLARLTSTIDSFDLKVQELSLDSKTLLGVGDSECFHNRDEENHNVLRTPLISNARRLQTETVSDSAQGTILNINNNTYCQGNYNLNEEDEDYVSSRNYSGGVDQQQLLNSKVNAVVDNNIHQSSDHSNINIHLNTSPFSSSSNNNSSYRLSSNSFYCKPLVTSMQCHPPALLQRKAMLNTPPIHRASTGKCSQALLFSEQRLGCGTASSVLEGGAVVVASTATASATVTSL